MQQVVWCCVHPRGLLWARMWPTGGPEPVCPPSIILPQGKIQRCSGTVSGPNPNCVGTLRDGHGPCPDRPQVLTGLRISICGACRLRPQTYLHRLPASLIVLPNPFGHACGGPLLPPRNIALLVSNMHAGLAVQSSQAENSERLHSASRGRSWGVHSPWSNSYQAPTMLQALSQRRASASTQEDKAMPSQNTYHVYMGTSCRQCIFRAVHLYVHGPHMSTLTQAYACVHLPHVVRTQSPHV